MHTELYEFGWNILTDILSREYPTDLKLGKVDELLIAYNIPNSWLSSLGSFDFSFSLRDTENQQYLSQHQLQWQLFKSIRNEKKNDIKNNVYFS